jgi:WD40 repeat protein
MSKVSRDDFPQAVINSLAKRAGHRCSNPACNCSTIGPQPSSAVGAINIGVAAHIAAASPGGKRYRVEMSSHERRAITNGIWLCQDCAKLIDSDEATYSCEVLRGWKELAELRAFEAIAGEKPGGVATFERRLDGHTNFVWDVAVTPDGHRIVSASNDTTVKIWNSTSGALICTLRGHDAFVCSLAISADGQRLATGDINGRVFLWNLSNGQQVGQVDHGSGDAKVCWKPDGVALISGGSSGALRVWDAKTLSALGTLSPHQHPILKLACLKDNRRIVSVSVDQTVRICSLDSKECLNVFEGHTGEVNSVAITPDERFLVSASTDTSLRIWDLEAGKCVRALFGHGETVWRVAISPDGSTLASGSGDNTVCLWDIRSGKLLQTLQHPDCVAAVTFNPVNNRLVVGCDDSHIYLYKLKALGPISGD